VALTYSMVLRRALLAGLIAGGLLALYLWTVVEPTIDEAVALEASTAGDVDHAAPLFTRAQQVGGGMLASAIYGLAVATIFGTLYAAIRHRLTARSDFFRVVHLAVVAFATTALLPMLKYPANPPAVGDPDTVNQRTVQYLSLLVFSIVAAVLVARLSAWLRTRLDDPTRVVVLAVATVALYGGALLVFPASPDSIDPAVPAGLIWRFRIQSLGGLALVWAVLGLGLGWMLERLVHSRSGDRAPAGLGHAGAGTGVEE
jgi:predicted cobalt transporter CbtA